MLDDASGSLGFRNRIINGDMRIDQRNAGAAINSAASGSFGVDRWIYEATQSARFNVQQNAGAVTPPPGFTHYLGLTSTSAYSVLTSDIFYISQRVEGFNSADFAWGTASARNVTLSFWVRSSLTGTFGGCIQNSAQNRSYPFTYSISAANTWEEKSVTIPGDTSGTWLTNNGVGLYLFIGLGVGTTFSGTAGAWSGSSFRSASGSVSVVGTNGATFYITGVQLEVGSSKTPFERRPYGTELALCQRYLPAFNSTGTNTYIASCVATSTTNARVFVPFLVQARTSPTGITVSSAGHLGFTGTLNATAFGVAIVGVTQPLNCGAFDMGATGLTAGQAGAAYFNNASGQLLFTGCEL